MKFGLLYEMEGPWTGESASFQDGFEDVLQQVKVAEQAGFDSVWTVEHHGPGRRGRAAAPEIWLAALAHHTDRIRIGHAARLLPFEYNHPVRVAEMAAVLDIMSDGRLELGTGLLGSTAELEALGVDPAKARVQREEVLRMIPRMWLEDDFSWDSEHFTMPPRSVWPKPIQSPHPPLWMSGTTADEAAFAGSRGLGFMHLAMCDPARIERAVEAYREGVARAEAVGSDSRARFAAAAALFCASDDGAADTCVGPSMQGDANAAVIGSPERCIESLEAYRSCGVDEMRFVVQVDGVSQADVRDSLHRFGREVRPHLER